MAKSNDEMKNKLAARATAPATVNGGTKQTSVATTIHDTLKKMGPQIQMALPRHMTVDRLTRTALTVIRTTPKLLQCSTESLCAAVMQAAQLGLEPGLLGHCYFVPFWNSKRKSYEVTFIIGYRGLVELARRSGNIKTIQAALVYENDQFDYEYGIEPLLRHVPKFGDRGELVGAYAYAIAKDGGIQFEVMTLDEIESIRQRSKAKDAGPWVSDFGEMAKKTVVRRLSKMLTLSVQAQETIEKDAQIEYGEEAIEIDLGDVPEQEPEEPKLALEEGGVRAAVAEPLQLENPVEARNG